MRLLATLTVWSGVLFGGFGYLMPVIWDEWWPWAYHEYWETSVNPQSAAYGTVHLRAERKMYCWGQHYDRPIFKRPWIATATIDVPGQGAAVTLEMDSFLDEWRWTPPDGTATRLQDEPQPEFVVQQMKAAGIDTSKPGVQEEAVALIGLVKDAAKGVLLGRVPSRGHAPSGGTKIGPFIASGGSSSGSGLPEGAVGPVDRRLLAGVLLLAIWSPGILIIVRRHRRRLAAAHETEQRVSPGNDRILGRDPLPPGCGSDFDPALGLALIIVPGFTLLKRTYACTRCILQLVRNRERPGTSHGTCAVLPDGLLQCASLLAASRHGRGRRRCRHRDGHPVLASDGSARHGEGRDDRFPRLSANGGTGEYGRLLAGV